MKIYTKTGDTGETSLFDNTRVSKADPRVDAYGDVDEVNACLGVARVLFRVFVATGDPGAHAVRRHLWSVSETLVPRKHVFEFNQGIMDLGAVVCTPRKPRCGACPISSMCRSSGLSQG